MIAENGGSQHKKVGEHIRINRKKCLHRFTQNCNILQPIRNRNPSQDMRKLANAKGVYLLGASASVSWRFIRMGEDDGSWVHGEAGFC